MKRKLLLLLFLVAANINYAQDNYLDFDGINDFVDVQNSADLLHDAGAFSMCCKVFPTRVSSGFPDFNGILGYRNEANFDFYLIQLSSTQLEARFRNSAGTAFTITYNGLVLNQWNQFYLVYDGANLKLYGGDGSELGSVAASGTAPAMGSNPDDLKIGLVTYQAFDWYHQGYIDEVSIWNKALQPVDIYELLGTNGVIQDPTSEPNLMLYYKFDQGIPYGDNSGLATANGEVGPSGTLTNFALTGTNSNWGGSNLGIAQHSVDGFTVYPNPAADRIAIEGATEAMAVKIVDETGRVVLLQEVPAGASIDVSKLEAGIYVVVLNDTIKRKFVKR